MEGRFSIQRYLLLALAGFLAIGIVLQVPIVEAASTKGKTTQKAGLTDSKRAGHWFRKGSLSATYGNDRAAIIYFKKAIALNPAHSGAFFSQGVSYGQLGQYANALASIDKAIALNPENGHYYYGRGRVHLLAGNHDSASLDFKKAAELGDEDAQIYLGQISAPKVLTLE